MAKKSHPSNKPATPRKHGSKAAGTPAESRANTQKAMKGQHPARSTKSEAILALLRRKSGASIEELTAATGWQAHSVRGFLSGTIKKKFALKLDAENSIDGVRRYYVRAAS